MIVQRPTVAVDVFRDVLLLREQLLARSLPLLR
jgi:hypothetical protein